MKHPFPLLRHRDYAGEKDPFSPLSKRVQSTLLVGSYHLQEPPSRRPRKLVSSLQTDLGITSREGEGDQRQRWPGHREVLLLLHSYLSRAGFYR